MTALRTRDVTDRPGNLGFRLQVFNPPARPPLVPPITTEELRRRNAAAIAHLNEWERDGDTEEQAAALEVLRRTLGPERIASYRNALP